ncbi:hypothetical protein HYDPIDRAFT_109821 [Hydnomerulius pinastri MD-312]|nr:hypothetical protein HYDPIDRAFT_109821 [Hydnomerulius pinastri MD-312]
MSSSGSTAVPGDTEILDNTVNLVAVTTISGLFYGISLSLFTVCARSLVKSLKVRRSAWVRTCCLLVYTTLMFVCATLYTAANSSNAVLDYVDHPLLPGGQLYSVVYPARPITIMGEASYILMLWMADAFMLWRFAMFYRSLPYGKWVVPVPGLMYLSILATSSLVLAQASRESGSLNASVDVSVPYYSLSLSLNIILTLAIAIRLWMHKREFQRAHGPRNESQYTSTLTMLIESSALYGVWSVVYLILFAKGSRGMYVLMTSQSQIQVIAPMMIIYRIARGKAWEPTTASTLRSGNHLNPRPSRFITEPRHDHLHSQSAFDEASEVELRFAPPSLSDQLPKIRQIPSQN